MIKPFFSALWNIILLRGGPQNFPYSPRMLISLVAVGIALMALATGAHVVLLLSNLAFMLMMVWLLLYFTKKTERYVQTMTALFACEWVMAIILLIIWYTTLLFTAMAGNVKGVSPDHLSGIFSIKFEKDTLPMTVAGFLGVILFVLGVWKLIINITIIRQAVESRFLRAMVFVVLLNVVPSLIEQGMIKAGVTKAPAAKTISISTPAASAPGHTTTVIPLK